VSQPREREDRADDARDERGEREAGERVEPVPGEGFGEQFLAASAFVIATSVKIASTIIWKPTSTICSRSVVLMPR
jgi:hypothetical protein